MNADTTNPTGTATPGAAASETFAVDEATADAYEARFVPAIFAPWAPRLLDACPIGAGDHVLDVACGTGIVARHAVDRVGPGGSVTGADVNPAMLEVAARIAPEITWHRADVADLPFDDGVFDATVCQMAMMFFPDREAALREMARVTRPDGVTAVLVPASLGAQPAYGVFVELAGSIVGPEARSLLGAYWSCGDLAALTAWHDAAGLFVRSADTGAGPARFASVEDFVRTEVGASPLAGRIDPGGLDRLCAAASEAMADWSTDDGFEIPLVCHVVVAGRAAA
jgi:SAM-dependent methyltransferase